MPASPAPKAARRWTGALGSAITGFGLQRGDAFKAFSSCGAVLALAVVTAGRQPVRVAAL